MQGILLKKILIQVNFESCDLTIESCLYYLSSITKKTHHKKGFKVIFSRASIQKIKHKIKQWNKQEKKIEDMHLCIMRLHVKSSSK